MRAFFGRALLNKNLMVVSILDYFLKQFGRFPNISGHTELGPSLQLQNFQFIEYLPRSLLSSRYASSGKICGNVVLNLKFVTRAKSIVVTNWLSKKVIL
jgi:hypothetical protein